MDRVVLREIATVVDRRGPAGAPTMLLVAGHGAPLEWWEEGLCALLVAQGFAVVRFDNRDAGESRHRAMDDVPPDIGALVRGDDCAVPYTLWDMAEDTVDLLDALGVGAAHLVGASMGGMIAQCVAVRHPERVRSLCSIMSTTGAPGVGVMRAETVRALAELAAAYPDPATGRLESARRFASPGFAFDEAAARERIERQMARGEPAGGVERQLAAMLVSGDRTEALARIGVPTVVIHGDADQMVPPDGGRATAAAIPGAELLVVAGMAHELPPEVWSEVVAAIVAVARRADAGADGRTTDRGRGG